MLLFLFCGMVVIFIQNRSLPNHASFISIEAYSNMCKAVVGCCAMPVLCIRGHFYNITFLNFLSGLAFFLVIP